LIGILYHGANNLVPFYCINKKSNKRSTKMVGHALSNVKVLLSWKPYVYKALFVRRKIKGIFKN
jgi:hypothetical protein